MGEQSLHVLVDVDSASLSLARQKTGLFAGASSLLVGIGQGDDFLLLPFPLKMFARTFGTPSPTWYWPLGALRSGLLVQDFAVANSCLQRLGLLMH